MKPVKNFTNHPALKYETTTYIFSIEKELYILTEQEVREIIPCRIDFDNIGEPYHDLVLFVYYWVGTDEKRYVYINPKSLSDLVAIIESVSCFDCKTQIPKRLQKYV